MHYALRCHVSICPSTANQRAYPSYLLYVYLFHHATTLRSGIEPLTPSLSSDCSTSIYAITQVLLQKFSVTSTAHMDCSSANYGQHSRQHHIALRRVPWTRKPSANGRIRTHKPFRANDFQDHLLYHSDTLAKWECVM